MRLHRRCCYSPAYYFGDYLAGWRKNYIGNVERAGIREKDGKCRKERKKDKEEETTTTDGAIQIVVEDSLGEPVKIVSEAAVSAYARRDELLAQQAAAAEENARKQAEEEAANQAKEQARAEAKVQAEAEAQAAAQQAAQTQQQGNLAQESGEGSSGTIYVPSTSEPTQTVDLNAYVDEVIRLVNVERANAGLAPLAKNGTACQAADIRASEIGVSFSHTRPDGRDCFTVFEEFGIGFTACGENIAMGQPSPEAVVEGWMNSPGHRANILNENFQEIGVGVKNVNGRMHWVQLFLRTDW